MFKKRELVKIYTIESVNKIEGADSIEYLTFNESAWQCVAKAGEFSVGDKAVYFEIDSLLPKDGERFAFMSARGVKKTVYEGVEYFGYRLKTVKLRGTLSQGLALPVSCFSELDLDLDLSEQLKIVKWELPMNGQSGIGQFHSIIPKTDEERIQNLKNKLPSLLSCEWEVTEKLEGQSCTVVMEEIDGVATKRVFSRSLERDLLGGDSFSIAANLVDIPVGYSVQGEVVGPNIQGNIYKLDRVDYFVYSVFDLIQTRYLSVEEQNRFLLEHNIKKVPVLIERFVPNLDMSVQDLLLLAEGDSTLYPTEREGVVFKKITSSITKNNFNKHSFKVISNKYLLKK